MRIYLVVWRQIQGGDIVEDKHNQMLEFNRQQHAIIDREIQRLKGMDSSVTFEIVGPEDLLEYREFLIQLMTEFILFLSPESERNQMAARGFERDHAGRWNSEQDGLSLVDIGDFYLKHCKLYLLDGEKLGGRKGVFFKDHNEGPRDVVKIHLLADGFERFLSEKDIQYERKNRKKE